MQRTSVEIQHRSIDGEEIDFTIVIPAYRGKSTIFDCLRSVDLAAAGLRYEVVVEIFPLERSIHLEYANQLEILEQVFGTQSVTAVPFHSSVLKEGCVVQDFLARAQIPFPVRRIRRLNEGLSLDALKLLLALRLHHGYPNGLSSIVHHEILFRRLTALSGPSLRFRSSLIAPLKSLWESQVPRMVSRFGELFQENAEDEPDPIGIGSIAEL